MFFVKKDVFCHKATRLQLAICGLAQFILVPVCNLCFNVVRYAKKFNFIGIMPSISQRRFTEQAFGVPNCWSSWTMINEAGGLPDSQAALVAILRGRP